MKIPHFNADSKSRILRRISVTYLASYQIAGLFAFVIGVILFIKLVPWHRVLAGFFPPTILLWINGLAIFASCLMAIVSLYKYHTQEHFHMFLFAFTCVTFSLITAAIIAHLNQNYIDNGSFLKDMREQFNETLTASKENINVAFWEYYQENRRCCGLEDFSDWTRKNRHGDMISKQTAEKGLKSCSCTQRKSKKSDQACHNITQLVVNTSLSLHNMLVFSVPCQKILVEEISFVCLCVRILAPILVITQLVIISCTVFIISRIQKSSVIENYKLKYAVTAEEGFPSVCPMDVFQVTPR